MRIHLHRLARTLLTALIASLALCGVHPADAFPSRDEAVVLQVIDGDTIVVLVGSRREHVRLIGIDTPESRPNRRAEKQSQTHHIDQRAILRYGNLAADFTRSLLPKKSAVFLEYDAAKRDHYQRLLAYVWLPSGSMVNEEIVRAGYGYLLTIPPNVRYRARFAAAFSEARRKQRGLWATNPSTRRH